MHVVAAFILTAQRPISQRVEVKARTRSQQTLARRRQRSELLHELQAVSSILDSMKHEDRLQGDTQEVVAKSAFVRVLSNRTHFAQNQIPRFGGGADQSHNGPRRRGGR